MKLDWMHLQEMLELKRKRKSQIEKLQSEYEILSNACSIIDTQIKEELLKEIENHG